MYSMPYVRMSLLKGKSPNYLRTLSEIVHRALVEAFDVPADDRFQIIHQHEPGELIFDPTYLGGPRSDDFVLITITAGKPRSTEVKKAFYRRVAELLEQSPGIRPEDVMIVINTTAGEDWSFSKGEIATPRAAWALPTESRANNPAELTIHRFGERLTRSPEGISTAPMQVEPLLDGSRDGENTAMRAMLDPGIITNWHTHPRGQLLYVLSGTGLVQRDGGPIITVHHGDSVWFAAGERHWHGAAPDDSFSYISIQAVQDGRAVDWLEPVETRP
jgi:quercetin dioxygenase-like cupin family protein/phenylpyruvate tautomerase PptA (4-oxalocrotonate tautomerase family)